MLFKKTLILSHYLQISIIVLGMSILIFKIELENVARSSLYDLLFKEPLMYQHLFQVSLVALQQFGLSFLEYLQVAL